MKTEQIKAKVFEAIDLAEKIINIKMKYEILAYYYDPAQLQINPCYHQMSEESSFVIEYYYGLPSKIYCPLGMINIKSGMIWDKYTHSNPDYQQKSIRELQAIFENELNLKMVQDKIIDPSGEYGPWFSVGDGKVYEQRRFTYEEARDLFQIYLKEYIREKYEITDINSDLDNYTEDTKTMSIDLEEI